MRLLNVGGATKKYALPDLFDGWEHTLLDACTLYEPPDIIMDCTELESCYSMEKKYNAIYCAHVLEHIPRRKILKTLRGFHHCLKEDGFAYIRVPDITATMKLMEIRQDNLFSKLCPGYEDNPVIANMTYHDVIYGSQEYGNHPYMNHLHAFTSDSLAAALQKVGFKTLLESKVNDYLELIVLAFKEEISDERIKEFI